MKLVWVLLLTGALGCGAVQIGSEGSGGTAANSGSGSGGAANGGNAVALGGKAGSGGAQSSGGSAAMGGSLSGGASPGAGGAASNGGVVGAGGAASNGGVVGAGGATSSGGLIGAGGSAAGGGLIGVGGAASSGGVSGAGGSAAGGAGNVTCDKLITIEGRITTPVGAPIEGVKVQLGGITKSEALTDANGAYAFPNICPGFYLVEPSRGGLSFCASPALNLAIEHDVREDFVASLNGCEPATTNVRLRVLVFDPLMGNQRRLSTSLGIEAPGTLVQRGVRALETLSNGRIHYQTPAVTVIDELPTSVDLKALTEQYQLCPPIIRELNLDEYDEVWVVGPKTLGLSPWQNLDAGCRRDIDVIGIDWQAGLAGLVKTYQQRSETVLGKVFEADGDENAFNDFERVGDTANGCGTSTQPSNASMNAKFDDTRAKQSYCAAYAGDPFSTPVATHAVASSCTDWFCNEFDYRRYWFMHLPKLSGVDALGHSKDWWRTIVHADDRRMRLINGVAVSCSNSYRSGWCENLLDGVHAECNDNEWAFSASSAYADFYFEKPRVVTQVTLFDRSCDEFVRRGHIEFSDGSDDEPFGSLERMNDVPKVVQFAPKTLTSLRVVIDQGSGSNPGLSEVIIE